MYCVRIYRRYEDSARRHDDVLSQRLTALGHADDGVHAVIGDDQFALAVLVR